MNKSIISTGSKEATQAGVEILKAGGNAFDAAVAAVFTSMTSEFALTGVGGGGAQHFLLLHQRDILAEIRRLCGLLSAAGPLPMTTKSKCCGANVLSPPVTPS